jgi:hypothetical protein
MREYRKRRRTAKMSAPAARAFSTPIARAPAPSHAPERIIERPVPQPERPKTGFVRPGPRSGSKTALELFQPFPAGVRAFQVCPFWRGALGNDGEGRAGCGGAAGLSGWGGPGAKTKCRKAADGGFVRSLNPLLPPRVANRRNAHWKLVLATFSLDNSAPGYNVLWLSRTPPFLFERSPTYPALGSDPS